MKRLVLLLAMLLSVCLVSAQQTYHQKANYDLASRFSPKKLEKMILSTAVDPHWTKSGNKFWYMYETTAGKKWVVVDPVKMTKTAMFDNDKLAANLTRIVKDPFFRSKINGLGFFIKTFNFFHMPWSTSYLTL